MGLATIIAGQQMQEIEPPANEHQVLPTTAPPSSDLLPIAPSAYQSPAEERGYNNVPASSDYQVVRTVGKKQVFQLLKGKADEAVRALKPVVAQAYGSAPKFPTPLTAELEAARAHAAVEMDTLQQSAKFAWPSIHSASSAEIAASHARQSLAVLEAAVRAAGSVDPARHAATLKIWGPLFEPASKHYYVAEAVLERNQLTVKSLNQFGGQSTFESVALSSRLETLWKSGESLESAMPQVAHSRWGSTGEVQLTAGLVMERLLQIAADGFKGAEQLMRSDQVRSAIRQYAGATGREIPQSVLR